jgi:hypothetical protein
VQLEKRALTTQPTGKGQPPKEGASRSAPLPAARVGGAFPPSDSLQEQA